MAHQDIYQEIFEANMCTYRLIYLLWMKILILQIIKQMIFNIGNLYTIKDAESKIISIDFAKIFRKLKIKIK